MVCSAKIEIIMYVYMTPSPGYRRPSIVLFVVESFPMHVPFDRGTKSGEAYRAKGNRRCTLLSSEKSTNEET